ncbi:MAG: right-handed parallel beta-helix repeat-containing protein, partial [Phycisphaerae bacterium]|nr:right-handed parallel beta-helix repeat-containing protein [Phycisphaerae bacterium]
CSNLTIANQTITDNTFGIALIDCFNAEVRDVTCRYNEQSNLFVSGCTHVDVSRCLFTNSRYGIDMTDSSGIEISNCELANNSAGMQSSQTGYILLNSLIHDNTQYGGIRHSGSSSQQGIIQGCTLINNSYGSSSYSGNGGAITRSPEYLTILDSILWNNSPGTVPEPDYYDYDITYCCVQDSLEGTGNFTEDPLLTSDGHLTLESPCIDAATPGRRIVKGVDMDGENRRVGSSVDIGADEYLDSDMDGLPDWFEMELDPNGLAMNPDDDLDGDDYTNIEEYKRFGGSALVPSGSTYVDPIHGDDLNQGNDPNQPKKTLQNALEVSGDGERIVLMPGRHEGDLTLRTQNTLIQSSDPKNPDVIASTLIASPIQLTNQSKHVEFAGLTFSTQSLVQGVLTLENMNATFSHCRFVENRSAPIMAYNATLTLKDCEFSRNTGLAGAALIQSSNVLMENCLITDNYDNAYSQALTLIGESGESRTTLVNCTIANNAPGNVSPELSSYYGMDYVPAILLYGAKVTVTNSILWDSHPLLLDLQEEGMVSQAWITFSNLSDTADTIDPNWLGLGNLSVDPAFAQLGYQPQDATQAYVPGDYHLLSLAGRWDPAQATWVEDTTTSLCIGAANPAWTPRDPNWTGTRLNLGAYGNSVQQSLAPDPWSLLGDLTNDGTVDALDETAFTQLQSDPRAKGAFLNALPGDLDQDGDMDIEDLQILQGQTGQTTPWHIQGVLNDRWSAPPVMFQPAAAGGASDGVSGGVTGGR